MRILVLGAGATGGYFGGRLAAAGRDVAFLVRPARAESLRRDGLRIVSPYGDATVKPRLVSAGAVGGPYDMVLFTAKAYALDAAMEDVAPAVGPETMILPVLNGMRHIDAIRTRFGETAALGGVCRIVSTLDGEGRVVHLKRIHELVYGEMDGSASPRIERLDAVMQGAGFAARLSREVEREMWEKWFLLAGMGGINCLMRATVGEIVAAPHGQAFVQAYLDELAFVIGTVGRTPRESFLKEARAMLTEEGSPLTSSMYRDLEKGGPIEADQILGDLLARAERAGLKAPLLGTAYANLAVYQERRERQAAR